jgi:phosphopantothenoylcysteine decarboxylase/phosphopantothenate--cysteine ligase
MRILVGVTGGVAAYKAVSLVRLLVEQGHDVKVIPTANAQRFVGDATFEAISKNTVDSNLYSDVAEVKHVALGQSADLIIVAPATASFLARAASGFADDLLSNAMLASTAPVLVAPAMHTEMWSNAATQANVATLRARGIHVLEPEVGRLTGSDSGKGRLPDPASIAEAALALVKPQDLSGMRIVVTAGGTREPIDPVRFIANRSSGKQGIAIARAAEARGATVTVIAANLAPDLVAKQVDVSTASELQEQLDAAWGSFDVLIMTAAVSDYRVVESSTSKLKKSSFGAEPVLKLTQNPDILAELSIRRGESKHPLLIGFAAETATSPELEHIALAKLNSKGVDIIVANDVSNSSVFGSDENSVVILDKTGKGLQISGSKPKCAEAILDALVSLNK